MRKALVTGGLGFIGFHLTRRLLDDGYEVHAIDNGERGVLDAEVHELMDGNPRYRLIQSDLSAEHALDELPDDFDPIFHLAAIVGVGNVARQPYRVLRDNTAALVCMLECGAKGSESFSGLSSRQPARSMRGRWKRSAFRFRHPNLRR